LLQLERSALRALPQAIVSTEEEQLGVESIERHSVAHWSEEVVLDIAVSALDAALFIPLTGSGKLHVECEASAEGSKLAVDLPASTAQHFVDGGTRVVKDGLPRDAAEFYEPA
jgi:hypothetical protein